MSAVMLYTVSLKTWYPPGLDTFAPPRGAIDPMMQGFGANIVVTPVERAWIDAIVFPDTRTHGRIIQPVLPGVGALLNVRERILKGRQCHDSRPSCVIIDLVLL